MDARKTSIGREDALKLLEDVDELYACKGKRVTTIDLRTQKPTADELAALIIGPTGNLRAPALRVGRKLIVGFEPETYKKFFA